MSARLDAALRVRGTEHLRIAAVASAAGCGRLFVRQVCASWQIGQEPSEVAELLASELITNAIVATWDMRARSVRQLPDANVEHIGIRLLAFDDSFVIEVWDSSPELPKLIASSWEAEHGRGLQLVEALSIRWGYYHARFSGKVVWCQLALPATAPAQRATADAEAFQRVLGTVQAHPWDGRAYL